jgi:hypothetical protein
MDFSFIGSFISMMAAKWGIVGTICAYIVAFIPIFSLALDIAKACVKFTSSTADDEAVGKVEEVWNKYVYPVLGVLPHMNIPVSAMFLKVTGYIVKGVKAILAAIASWKSE